MDVANDRRFHVAQQGRRFGPLSLAELSSRRLTSDMLVWCDGMPEWVAIGEIPELRPFVQHAAATRTSLPPTRYQGGGHSAAAVSDPAPAVSVSAFAMPVSPPAAPASGGGRVMFVGITTLALGSLGLFITPIGIVWGMLSIAGSINRYVPAEIAALVNVRAFGLVLVMLCGTLFIVSIAMAVAGIGLLRKLHSASIISMTSSLVCVVVYLISLALGCGFVLLPLASAPIVVRPLAMQKFIDRGIIVGTVTALGTCIAIAWHVTSLVLLNSAAVRRTLR